MIQSSKIPSFIEKNRGKYFCKCGCNQKINVQKYHKWSGIPNYIYGHYSKITSRVVQYFIDANQGKHFCKCGCGQEIIIKRRHKYVGIPGYINYHYIRTEEYRLKNKEKWNDPYSGYNTKEYKKKQAMGGKNRIITKEYRRKCSLAKIGEKNPNYRKIPSHLKDIHKNWKCRDPKGYQKHQQEAGKKAFVSCPHISKLENRFCDFLKELNIEFTPQFCYELGYIDILIKPNIALFIDGDFWHGNPKQFPVLSDKQLKQKKKDIIQTNYLINKKFNVIRIWESSIKTFGLTETKNFLKIIIPEVQ